MGVTSRESYEIFILLQRFLFPSFSFQKKKCISQLLVTFESFYITVINILNLNKNKCPFHFGCNLQTLRFVSFYQIKYIASKMMLNWFLMKMNFMILKAKLQIPCQFSLTNMSLSKNNLHQLHELNKNSP